MEKITLFLRKYMLITAIAAIATVLGVIAGVLASISHKRLGVWFMFAAIVGYSLSFCLILQENILNEEKKMQESKQAVEDEKTEIIKPQPQLPEPPIQYPLPIRKMFVKVEPEYFKKIFDDNTHIQANKLFSVYIGKWIKFMGAKVSQVSRIQSGGKNYIYALVWMSDEHYLIGASSENEKWGDYAETLRRGDTIDFTGEISRADGLTLYVENCELIEL